MRRIERLINLIAALLETPRPMTADEIRERIAGYDQPNYEAFRRSFERDKEALRAMGIPLEVVPADPLSERSVEGYVIPKERYYLPQLDLEPDELAALQIAAQALPGAGDAAGAGVLKLALQGDDGPAPGPRAAWGADVAAEQPLLAPLYAALLERRRVSFRYRRGSSDDVATRTVEPYGVVHRRGNWYLVGRDLERDAVRSFRVSRIEGAVRREDAGYEVPEGFDSSAYVGEEAWETGPDEPSTALVRFDAPMRWWAEQNLQGRPRRDAPGGALEVELPVANLDALVSWVVGFAGAAEIVEPLEARRRLVAHVAALAEPRS